MRSKKEFMRKIITICSSASHYKQVLEIEEKLKEMKFIVKIPTTARIMQKQNNFDVAFYKTWLQDKNHYSKKRKLMSEHFRKIISSNAILVLNLEKNGVDGYIGGNVLMEMALAFHYSKPVFIYNDIDDNLSIKEEVYGLAPFFIKQDLMLIAKRIVQS